jgi:transcriptional regulator with XRE-family HTH domain
VRAARAYANLKQPELATASGVGYATIENELRVPMLEELRSIADACDVPRAFLEQGFASADVGGALASAVDRHEQLLRELDPADTRARLRNVESQLATLVDSVSRLADQTRQLDRDARQRDQETLERETAAAVERDERRRGRTASSAPAQDARGR